MRKGLDNKEKRWSTEPGIAVRDRELKLNFFQKGEVRTNSSRILCVHRFSFGSRQKLAAAIGLKGNPLRANKLNPENLSRAALDALGRYFGFDADCEEWLDGTALEFAEHYNKYNSYRSDRLEPSDDKSSEERRTDIPLVPCYDAQEVGGHRLASLRMEAVLSNDSERWPIKLYLRCRAPHGYGIGKGFIDLYTGDAIAPEDEQNFHEEFKLPGSDVTIRVDTTTQTKASWAVTANSGVIDDVLPDESYCVVRRLAPEDKLTVTFSIANKDISGAEEQIRHKDGQPLGRKKNAILDRIASYAVLNDDNGYIVLCRHEATFEDAYADQRSAGLSDKINEPDA